MNQILSSGSAIVEVPPSNPNQPTDVTQGDLYTLKRNSFELLVLIGIYLTFQAGNWARERISSLFIPNSFDYNNTMNDYASRLLTQTEADRVTIGIFTNGERFVNNVGIKYMLIPVEKVSPGTATLYGKRTSIPINTIAEEMKCCESSKDLTCIHNVNDKSLSSGCRGFLTKTGVKYLVNILIPGHGFIGIQYNKRRNINERQIKVLLDTIDAKETISVLSAYISKPRHVEFNKILQNIGFR